MRVKLGTIDYLSPEACLGRQLDERSDIWRLGVILYEALAGQLPCQAKNLGAKIIAILTQPVPDLSLVVPDVRPALAALLRRMLDKDLPQRIRSGRLVNAELEATLSQR